MPKPFLQNIPRLANIPRTLTLYSYGDGLNNVGSQTLISNQSATNVLNMEFLEDGLIQKRYGTNPFNEVEAPFDLKYFDIFQSKEGEKLITSTDEAVYVDSVKIADVRGAIKGITYNDSYLFIDGTFYYVYTKVKEEWKCLKIIQPQPKRDSLKKLAEKGAKEIEVMDGSLYQEKCYIQIGEHIRGKDSLDDTPPPQVCRVLKIEGNIITLGEEVTEDNEQTETTTNADTSDTNDTTKQTSNAVDKTTTEDKKTSGNWDGDKTVETTVTSNRQSGTSNTETHVISTGVTITKTVNKNAEDTKKFKYHRLEYDYKAMTPIFIYDGLKSYAPIGKTVDTTVTRMYEPCSFELSDIYKGQNLLPNKPNNIALHKNRVIITGDLQGTNTVYMSNTNNPFYFPAMMGVSTPSNGDSVVGLISFHDALVVARSGDMYVLYGSSAKPDHGDLFKMMQINTHAGCANGNTLCILHNFLFYLGSDGVVYRMHTTQTDMRMLATSVASPTLDLFKKPLELDLRNMKNASASFVDGKYYLNIGEKTLLYNYKFQSWTVFDRLGCSYMGKIKEEPVWIKGKRLFHFDKDTFQDEGIEFNCFWESKLFDLDLPVNYKYFKYISLVFETFEHFDSTARLLFEIDYEDVKIDYVFKNAISRWGVAKWGVDRFAKRNINKSLPNYVGRRGRLVKVKVHNGTYVKYFVETPAELESLKPNVGEVAYISSTKTHTQYTVSEDLQTINWTDIEASELNQPIRLYNVEIEYSIRGRR